MRTLKTKIKIRHNHWLPKLIRANGITIYPYICLRDEPKNVKKSTYKHELEHCYQVEDVGWAGFYLSYIFYFLAAILRYRDFGKAYHEIPYEKDAYAMQDNSFDECETELLIEQGVV